MPKASERTTRVNRSKESETGPLTALAPVAIAGRHRLKELSLAEVKVQPMANVIIRMFTRDLDGLRNQRLVSIGVGRGVKFQGRNEGSTEVQVLVPDEQFQEEFPQPQPHIGERLLLKCLRGAFTLRASPVRRSVPGPVQRCNGTRLVKVIAVLEDVQKVFVWTAETENARAQGSTNRLATLPSTSSIAATSIGSQISSGRTCARCATSATNHFRGSSRSAWSSHFRSLSPARSSRFTAAGSGSKNGVKAR